MAGIDPLPQRMNLAPHERILTVTMINDIKVWLTTHRLVLWDAAVMVIPLTAIGPMVFTHIIYRARIAWGILLAALAVASGLGAKLLSQPGTYARTPTWLGFGAVVLGIAACVAWLRVSGPWVWKIYGSGGQIIEEYELPRQMGEQVGQVAAQTADAIVRILPQPQ